MAETPARPLPEHVTEPLLSLITRRSLDADYEHVAARKQAAGASGADHPAPRRTAAVVLLLFGALVTVAAVQTSKNAGASSASRESLINQIDLRRQAVSNLNQQMSDQQQAVTALERSLTATQTRTEATQARLDQVAAAAGFGSVRGQGVRITVANAADANADQLVRDSDLTLLANALWASGAQAVSVNGQRLTASGAFRNVGLGILVNSQPINPPYVFQVIGNPDTLPAALLSSSAGAQWYALKNSLGFRFSVTDGGTMTLPAARTPTLRSARLAPATHHHQHTQHTQQTPGTQRTQGGSGS